MKWYPGGGGLAHQAKSFRGYIGSPAALRVGLDYASIAEFEANGEAKSLSYLLSSSSACCRAAAPLPPSIRVNSSMRASLSSCVTRVSVRASSTSLDTR